ncbi:unnamed protein product [Alopecurus aequalis]
MAPSKSHLAFFLAIALVAVMPAPSTAARAEPPTSSTTGSMWALPSCIWPIFGPPTPSAPVTPSKTYPKECLPSLMGLTQGRSSQKGKSYGLTPCKDFMTNHTAPAPSNPSKCCDGLNSIYKNVSVCMCHLDNGNLEKLFAAPIDGDNFLQLIFKICKPDLDDVESCDEPSS